MLMTLQLNGIKLRYTEAELIALGLGVADGRVGYEGVLEWVERVT